MITDPQRTKPIPGLIAANAARTERGSARTVAVLAEFFTIGDTTGATEEMLLAGRTRLEHPDESLSQLAARLGWSRDSFSGRLRRLEQLAHRAHARLATARA